MGALLSRDHSPSLQHELSSDGCHGYRSRNKGITEMYGKSEVKELRKKQESQDGVAGSVINHKDVKGDFENKELLHWEEAW